MTMITGTWAERCAADADARDWAMTYGRGEFYYSEKWGELTAIADGTTTLTDVADAIAAGTASPYHEALAAHYFAQAADYLAGVAEGRVADAKRGHPVPALEDDNGQIPWLRDDSELAMAEMNREFAEAAQREAHQVAREAVDREDDARRWADAEDEDSYHAAGAAAALAADVNEAWRKAVGVEYDQRCAEYSNDGRPEDDRHISAEDKAAQAAAVAAIAERTGLPTGAIWDAVRDITDRYARDHTDTATLGQPDWDQVADSWADMLAQQQAYRDGGARAAAAAALEAAARDREITGTYRDMGWTAEQIAQTQDNMTVAQAQDALDRLAAYETAVSPPAAEPGTDAHNLVLASAWDEAAYQAAGAAQVAVDPALAAEEAAIEASIEAAYGGDDAAGNAVGHLSDQDDGAEVARVADYLTGSPHYVANILHGGGVDVYQHAQFLVSLGFTATNLAELDAQGQATPTDADRRADALEDRMWRIDAGLPADPEGDAAYRAAVEASRANWYARAAQLGVTTASPTPTAEVDTWAAKNPAGEWAANEDVVARSESDAALTAEAGDGAAALDAHQQRLAEAAVTRDDVTLAHPPAVTDAPLYQHNAILNRGQLADRLAELTATAAGQVDDGYIQEPEEQLAGQLIADAHDRGDPPPPEGWSRWARPAQTRPRSQVAEEVWDAPEPSGWEWEEEGESPGKAEAADAVAAAHEAVAADTQRAASELTEQQQAAHTSEPARVTDVSEQAPTMEAGA